MRTVRSAEETAGAEPDRQDEALGEDGEKNDGQRRVPDGENGGVEERVEWSVAGDEIAIRKRVLHDGVCFRDIEGGDVAAHGEVKRGEHDQKDAKPRKNEGDGDSAIEGLLRRTMDAAAAGQDVAGGGDDHAEGGARLEALDSCHACVEGAADGCMGRVYGTASLFLL